MQGKTHSKGSSPYSPRPYMLCHRAGQDPADPDPYAPASLGPVVRSGPPVPPSPALTVPHRPTHLRRRPNLLPPPHTAPCAPIGPLRSRPRLKVGQSRTNHAHNHALSV